MAMLPSVLADPQVLCSLLGATLEEQRLTKACLENSKQHGEGTRHYIMSV